MHLIENMEVKREKIWCPIIRAFDPHRSFPLFVQCVYSHHGGKYYIKLEI